jgi:hypothetical protein
VNRELTRCGVDFNFLDAISIAAFVVAVGFVQYAEISG